MVKGVNKSIIEISETGSKYFSRVILFVSPEYVQKGSKKLTSEAQEIIKKIQMSDSTISLRSEMSRIRKKKILTGTILVSVILIAVTTALIVVKNNIL